MSLDSHLVSLRTLFDPERAGDLDAVVQLRFEGGSFAADIGGGAIEVSRNEIASPDATIVADPGTFLDVLHGRRELDDALRSGELRFEGDEELATRFTTLFPLPEPALA